MSGIAIVLVLVLVLLAWHYYLCRIAKSINLDQLGQDVADAQKAYQSSLSKVAELEAKRDELLGG